MEKEEILVCENCGSRNVETMAWVKLNKSNSFSGYIEIEDPYRNWCCDCESHVLLITLSEYKNKE
jgi:hypothetical protein